MNQELGTIYIATNLINGKQYVGQTSRTLQERIYSHKNQTYTRIIHRAISKYGLENFKWIHFDCPIEDLDFTEILLIKDFSTLVPNGYNLETGGHKNKKVSEETKEKHRQRFLGKNNPMYGKKRPEISEQMKGENHHFWGKKRPEHSEAMKLNWQRRKLIDETK